MSIHSTFGKSLCTQAAKSAVCRDRPSMFNELKTAITAFIRNISQADLQKVFTNKLNVFRPVDITSNTFYKCTATFRTNCVYIYIYIHIHTK
jgi:hypothetical protein